jgi:NAD(P)-dependent dehydrogenase (short-subunit alcohol dehydrogenase family)
MKLLEGKTVVVTGASTGIGRAIAIGAAQHGADVAINFARDTDGAAQCIAGIEAAGQRVFPDWFALSERPHLLKALASAPQLCDGCSREPPKLSGDASAQQPCLSAMPNLTQSLRIARS